MSAVAAIFDHSGAPVEPGALERILDGLAHRGPDGRDAHVDHNAALGHCHFWATPEEVGERQPLRAPGAPFTVVFDGRLDNRRELIVQLGIAEQESSAPSDAALLLRAYERWGARCFEHLLGEFAAVVHDERRAELLMARDAMGERTLFYRFEGERVLIASEPAAIAANGGDLDDEGLAYFFAFEVPEDGRTLFRDVRELLPAEVIVVGPGGHRRWRYWEPDFTLRHRGRSDEEYAEQFLSLLEESVRCRLRATTPVGIQMSGGLDSASVASIAARMVAPERVTTISWVFDELTDCDERDYIESMKARWNIRSLHVPGDDAWPLKNAESWPHTPNHPEMNPLRMLKVRGYRMAEEEGLRVLLTGCYGDELFCRGSDWLADLLVEGRIGEAARELSASVRRDGFRRTIAASSTRRVGRRLLGPLAGFRRRKVQRMAVRPWLTASAANVIAPVQQPTDSDLEMKQTLVRVRAYESTGHLGHPAIELRHPFRDRRLVEFALTLPAHQSFNRGVYKHVLRTAMKGILPERIRTRRNRTLISSLYFRGMERERAKLRDVAEMPDAGWRTFVDADWLSSHWDPSANRNEEGVQALVPWMCASYEVWKSSRVASIMCAGANDAKK